VIRAIWTLGRVLLTIAIIAYVLRGFDVDAAKSALRRFSAVAIEESLILIAIDRGIMFWRWLILIRAVSPAPPRQLARIFFVSSFLGSFLPAGVGGDAACAFQVGRQTGRVGGAIASVVVDRWIGLLAVGISGCVGVLASLAAVPAQLRSLTIAITMALVAGGLAALYADRIVDRILPEGGVGGWLSNAIRRLSSALAVYRRYPRDLWIVGALSLAVQAARITLAWVIGSGLGIALPFSYYWVFMPLNILIILLPLSLGGFGLPQGTMVWTLGPLGVAPTEAFLLSLLFVLAGVVGNLPGALLYAFGPRHVHVAGGNRRID
jgi:glycosyltransferase 2 family protein